MKSIRLLPLWAVFFLAVGVVFPPAAHAFKAPAQEPLPNYDRRQAAAAKPFADGRAAGVAQLRGRVPGLQVDFDEIRGTPKHISSTDGFLSGPGGEGRALSPMAGGGFAANDPHRPMKAFLNEHSALFGHGAEILVSATLKREFVTRHNGLRSVIWEQQLDQIPVYEGLLMGHVTKHGELVSISSQFLPNLEQAANAGTPNRALREAAPAISAVQALLRAVQEIGEDVPASAVAAVEAQPRGAEKRQKFKAGALPGEAQVKLVWLPMDRTTLRLCWQVELTRGTGGERFRVLIDVQNGESFLRRRLTLYLSDATYRVFTSDSPSPLSPGYPTPTTNQPPLIARSLVTLGALFTNASPIGWISDGQNETRGNNADAHLDLNADDLPDLPRPQGSPFRVFDFPQDLSQAPSAYREASVVQLFYWCNWMHDQFYELGFTEAAGNFQKDNFGRGGAGNDAVQADAQDGSGFNNANFTPTDDGESPRVQMYLFNGVAPSRDGDLDAEIILHECTHGLSTRLVGGGAGISALQTEGMGEGWSDFYALTFLSEASDDIQGNYVEGGYATYQFFGLTQNYYYGIRRYPYTTDLTKNPLTFKDIDPFQISPHPGVPLSPIESFNPISASEVHHQGEVWCVTLWEARAKLIQKHGFAKGQQLILQLVTDGMKLGPPNPTFLQARDAILQADFVNNDGANYNELWSAFAKRGLGFSATAASSSTTSGVHESFDLPDGLLIVPSTPFLANGPAGGPLLPNCMTYVLTNHTSNALSWTAISKQPWFKVTPATGNLAAGRATNVMVCLVDGGSIVPLGSHFGSVVFSNVNSRVAQRRDVHVRVLNFGAMPFTEDFESGELRPEWMVTGTGDFHTQVTTNEAPHGGRYQLILDSKGSGDFARNELTLGLDLGGYSNVVLRFWAKQFGDEPDRPPSSPFIDGADFDGVAISQDGVAWYEAQGLRDLPATNTLRILDLDGVVAAHGLAFNSRFQIRFNHYDNFSVPIDGIALDDMSITGVAVRRLIVSVPKQASEGAGTLSNQGRVSLRVPAPVALTVSLASSDTSRVKVPATVILPAGAEQVTFDVFVQDNLLLDGIQPVVISAAATGYFGQSDVITVSDNEQASLRVRLPRRAVEGDGVLPLAGTLTVSAKPDRDITVHLSSSDTNEVQVPATLLLPAGQNRIDFDLTIIDDHKFDGTHQAVITAHVDNWTDGQEVIQVLDNETPVVSLVLPERVSEGDGVLTDAGTVQISGILETNLVVSLSSSDATQVSLPAAVVIPAGSTSVRFAITVTDDARIDGLRVVTVSATAPVFGVGTGTIAVLDNETPPVPYQPTPLDHSVGGAVTTDLAWRGGVGEILVNGGFETGDFTGWVQENLDYGSFIINKGTFDPDGPDGPLPPFDGNFDAMTQQIGGGTHTLYQDLLIPPDASSATLSWVDQIRNHGGQFVDSVQEFRVEIRDLNNLVMALAYSTKPGDPATNDWTKRSFDLTGFRGQTIRVAFFQMDHLGYFNLHLDNVSVRLGEPAPTSFDVYFGTNALPGAAQFIGNTTNQSWELPNLPLTTTFYWRVVGSRGAAQMAGPVWQFTTRGVGQLDHFEWSAIPPTQLVNQPFLVNVAAKDDINNTIPTFKGPLAVVPLLSPGTVSSVVITEIDAGTVDKVEFANVSGRRLNLSGWQISAYGKQSWPLPLSIFTVPSNTVCASGDVFLLSYAGEAPGFYPNFIAGTNVSWNNTAILGNPVAVLLQDAAGNLVDFVCAADANPRQIISPIPIPLEEWMGNPIPANTNNTLTYQRAGKIDHNNNSDWVLVTNNTGVLNPDLSLPFQPRHPISISPTLLTNFVAGVWSGAFTAQELVENVLLLASDGVGHLGFANPFTVAALNDLSLAVSNYPDVTLLGDEVNYQVTIANSGPLPATTVILTDPLPAGAGFVSATPSQGSCGNIGGVLFCNLGTLPAGSKVTVNVVLAANAAGALTNALTISRAEGEGYVANNTVSAVTTVNLPGLTFSVPPPYFSEGDIGTTNAVFSVLLSAPCRLPVFVNYGTSDETAIAGEDYIATNGTLVFPPGITNQTIVVKVIGDTRYELLESFFVNLSSPTNAALITPQRRGRIFDADPEPRLFIDDVTILESAAGTRTNALFTVRLTGSSDYAASATFTTIDGTALAGRNYVAQSGMLTFPPGVTNQTIAVAVIGNTTFENNATFSILLSSPINSLLGDAQGVCTILDNGASELDHFVFGSLPSPQYAAVPFIATITAKDGRNNTVSNFHGRGTVSAVMGSQTITVGNGAAAWPYPMGTLYHDSRIQTIYLAGEIGLPGRITALALQVKSPPGQTLSNWTMRLKPTPLAGYLKPAWETNGWTIVYQADQQVTSGGWSTFFFQKPFDYDGTNNLMLDVSFNNSTSSADGECFYTGTKPLRSLYFQTDSAFGSPLDWSGTNSPPPLATNQVPNIRLLIEDPASMTPTNPVQFAEGNWSGPVTIAQPATNVFLRVMDEGGHLGTGNFFRVDPSTDADHDGLPDAWEVRYFGSTSAPGGGPNQDPDGDGLTNLEEFRAGTNPVEASSGLRLLAVRLEGGGVRLSLATIAGKSYRLERTDHLSSAVWTVVRDNILGAGSSVEVTDAVDPGSRSLFYRIRLLQ